MTAAYLLPLFAVISVTIFAFGMGTLFFFPLSAWYLVWEKQLFKRPVPCWPRVSVLVPAYNEERMIATSIRSILRSDYPDFEVIVINDGSTDETERRLQPFVDQGLIRYLSKTNGGKASALNMGLAAASGEIVLFTDADSHFTASTLRNGVRYFADPSVGALGGNDTPLWPQGPLQKMLVLTSHIGTGLVRRALSVLKVLPIIPGNLGFVRTSILRQIGGFREVWGEDLELTIRLHRHRVRVAYGAQTKVLAECPHSIRALWKQRVRWVRSYIKVVRLHGDMVGSLRYGLFGPFLAFACANLMVVPAAQFVALLLTPFIMRTGVPAIDWLIMLSFLVVLALFLPAMYAVVLDRSPRHLRYLPYLLLMLPLIFFYNAVVLYSIWAEFRARPENWNKLDRRGSAPPVEKAIDPQRRSILVGATAIGSVAAGVFLLGGEVIPTAGAQLRRLPSRTRLTVAVHYSDWTAWQSAIGAVPVGDAAAAIDQIAISAGRADWTYFRSPGRNQWWSDVQRDAQSDMLAWGVEAVHQRGKRAVAILDVFASRYLRAHPGEAASDLRGRPSQEIVCSTVLAEGDYGNFLADAAASLARNTEAECISITELFYDTHCFDKRCLESFRRFSGRADWPRREDGSIDRLAPVLARWRSNQVAVVVSRLAYLARSERKQFLMDVRVSRGQLRRNSAENGQDYHILKPLVDQLVVWDYFALDGLSPGASRHLADYLVKELGKKHYWHSIGLWDRNHGSLGAEPMMRSLLAAVAGGAENIWITPGRKLTEAHWAQLAALRQAA